MASNDISEGFDLGGGSESNSSASDSKAVTEISEAFTTSNGKRKVREKGVVDIANEAKAEEGGAEAEQAEGEGEECSGKSWVWAHFKKIKKPVYGMQKDGKSTKRVQVGESLRVQCIWCLGDLAYDSKGSGTSTMGRHINNVCKKYPGRVKIDDGQQKLTSTGRSKSTKELVMVKWTEQGCREAAVKMMVMDELPFSFIEKPGFRYFCRYAVPDWQVPSRRVIVNQFLRMYYLEKKKLKKELKGHCLCLTTDTWTSVQNINYMVVTAHFIDSGWKMQKRILSFKVIPNHQGTSIGSLLEDCLLEWEVDRVLTISVDNASANKVAIEYIRERMLMWETAPLLDGIYMHVPCFAHIVNLIVRSGLDMIGTSIASIRNVVRYIRSSGQRLAFFKQCMEKEKVESKKVSILDVPTRWNSTYIMLSAALELRKVFDRMAREEGSKYRGYFDEDEDIEWDEERFVELLNVNLTSITISEAQNSARKRQRRKREGPPKQHDWEKAEMFVNFLKIFYDVTMRISASTKPTSWKAFHDIVAIKAQIEAFDGLFPKEGMSTSTDPIALKNESILQNMAENMRKKYEKYFSSINDCNQLLLVALVLNPRYKLRNFESTCSKWLKMDYVAIKDKSAELKELLMKLCDIYSTMNVTVSYKSSRSKSGESTLSSSSKSESKKSKRSVEPTGIIKDMEEDWERELEDDADAIVGHEVDRYLLDPIEKPPNPALFDILEWWKINCDKYPSLAALAKDILAIQVSTVAAESSFSTGRRVIDPFRSSLSPKTVEALICYQNWITSESVHNIEFIPTIEDMEFYEDVEREQEKEESERTVKSNLMLQEAQLCWPPRSSPSGRWTRSEDQPFELALVCFSKDLPDRWEQIADMVLGKTAEEVLEHLETLVQDLVEIDSGRVELPTIQLIALCLIMVCKVTGGCVLLGGPHDHHQ